MGYADTKSQYLSCWVEPGTRPNSATAHGKADLTYLHPFRATATLMIIEGGRTVTATLIKMEGESSDSHAETSENEREILKINIPKGEGRWGVGVTKRGVAGLVPYFISPIKSNLN